MLAILTGPEMTDSLTIKEWPDKYVNERFAVGAEWGDLLTELGTTIDEVEAEVINGTITIDDPVPSSFTDTTQKVILSGGAPGYVQVKCTMTTTDGDEFSQIYALTVKA
jgi:hypothetical protein